jgi:peroxiredoxin
MKVGRVVPMKAELNVGSLAPDFKLPAQNGTEIALANYYDKSFVVLFFVREYI